MCSSARLVQLHTLHNCTVQRCSMCNVQSIYRLHMH